MASSVDIAPSIGHACLTSQLGIGATPGYDSIDWRRLAAVGVQEGAHDATGWKVSEHSPNAMTVDVAANVGLATVQGDSVVTQGRYVVSPHSSVVTLDVAAAHASNPRIDQTLLRVYDTTHDGLGSNKATLEMLTGTATSGATLDNRNGAAALPNNAMRLADILVPAASGTVTNTNIRDRRPWAYGATWRGIRTQGNLAPGAGGALFEVGSAQLKQRIECSGKPVLVTAHMIWSSSAGSDGVIAGFFFDGALPDGASDGLGADWSVSAAGSYTANFAYMFTPSAGSHLFSFVASRETSSAVLYANANTPLVFAVQELLQPLGGNGAT